MEIPIFQIDAFTDDIFSGNPAAICPLDEWLPDKILQQIAAENNLSETAFFVLNEITNEYHIRWFTPVAEVDLCGHATLASAYVIFTIFNYKADDIVFQSKSGKLVVCKSFKPDFGHSFTLNFPVTSILPCETPSEIIESFGHNIQIVETWKCDDYMVVLDSEQAVLTLKPNLAILAKLHCRGVTVTAKADLNSNDKKIDFVSRFFAPLHGINEDPVTGSTHCYLAPYWSSRLNQHDLKLQLLAKQLSQRGGYLMCEIIEDRVLISGNAVKYLEGRICIS